MILFSARQERARYRPARNQVEEVLLQRVTKHQEKVDYFVDNFKTKFVKSCGIFFTKVALSICKGKSMVRFIQMKFLIHTD